MTMKPKIEYRELLEVDQEKSVAYVDVRSPKEYEESTIPGAFNIPVLDNETRAKVGTLYVAGKTEEAKQAGVEYMATRLPEMFQDYQRLATMYDEIVIFCSRGGMRSQSIFSLLKALGLPVSRLQGGYKEYRKYIREHLDEQLKKIELVTIYGLSGTGKTEVLLEIEKKGAHILDLEGCANHRGSLLGSVGLSEPHSQKMFESLLFDASRQWIEGDVVFTEGESKRIGQAVIPDSLFSAMKEGTTLYLEAPMATRVAQIYKEYVTPDNQQELVDSLERLKKFANPEKIQRYQEYIWTGQVDKVIEGLLTSYYDPRYKHRRKQPKATFVNTHAPDTACAILAWANEREDRAHE